MTALTRTYKRHSYYRKLVDEDGWRFVPSKKGSPRTMFMNLPDGDMLPDCVLDILQATTTPIIQPIFEKHLELDTAGSLVPPLNQHRILISEPQMALNNSYALVIAAFNHFDKTLGERVSQILSDSTRIELTKVVTGEGRGYCDSPNQESKYARLRLSYDGTINDPVYLAHELGHLLTCDFAQEAGYENRGTRMPGHTAELPAMFSQIILYDYLMHGQSDPILQNVAQQHFVGEMTRDLYRQQIAFANPAKPVLSQGEYERRIFAVLGHHELALPSDIQMLWPDSSYLHWHISASTIAAGFYFSSLGKKPAIFDAMFKKGKDSDILDMFGAAGISTEQALSVFMVDAVQAVIKPLDDIYAASPLRPVEADRLCQHRLVI
ncbi:MAG: hypothetical protein EB059_05415 [Alphaproteobacteria bacterium]|nr:hypothetical protein [Alphaproteobacteria bacterium]